MKHLHSKLILQPSVCMITVGVLVMTNSDSFPTVAISWIGSSGYCCLSVYKAEAHSRYGRDIVDAEKW